MPKIRSYLYEIRWPLFIGILVFAHNLHIDNLRGDAIRYALIAKQLLQSDNWLILHSGDELYLNKPPLFFWLTALAMKLFGVNPIGAQFTSIAFGVLLTMLVYHLGKALTGEVKTGLVAVMVLVTSRVILRNTDTVRLESLLTFLMLTALCSFIAYLHWQQAKWLLLAGFLTGLAIMTKGLPGLAPVAAMLIYALLYSRHELQRATWLHALAAMLVLLLTFGWWYAYAISHTPFHSVFFDNQVGKNLLDEPPVGHDAHPFIKYFHDLFMNYFYWLPLCLWGMFLLLRDHGHKPGVRLMLIFGALEFLILLSLNYKVMRYTYPLFTLLAVPTALGLTQLLQLNWERFIPISAATVALLFSILPSDEDEDNYAGLIEARQIARHNQVPLVLSGWYQSTWGSWVAQYYLDHNFHTSPPTTGDFIEVTDQPDQAHGGGLLLGRQGRAWIYLNSTARMAGAD